MVLCTGQKRPGDKLRPASFYRRISFDFPFFFLLHTENARSKKKKHSFCKRSPFGDTFFFLFLL